VVAVGLGLTESSMDWGKVSGRVAIVTGAGGGIGAAVARRLADDGNDVALLDVDIEACQAVVGQIEERGRRALALTCDVANEDDVRDAVRNVAATLGQPLILINNAGVIRDNLLFKMSLDEWTQVMDVHLRGAFLMSRECQTFMTLAKWGRIISISSTSALGNRGQANYAAAKAGLQGFTKTLALELGKFGVTANAVAPGFIQTAMTAQTAQRLGLTPDEFAELAAQQVAVGRIGYPEDVANAVAFFADERSSYVNGQILYVSGGPAT
jgi:3-oxoacyl-[acyl-carrier protein] reductase